MSVEKGPHKYKKVFRPPGTKYAKGTAEVHEMASAPKTGHLLLAFAVDTAFKKAYTAFFEEFGHRPNHENLVVEILGTTGEVTATIIEIPKEKDQ